jgi:hypothetical protein
MKALDDTAIQKLRTAQQGLLGGVRSGVIGPCMKTLLQSGLVPIFSCQGATFTLTLVNDSNLADTVTLGIPGHPELDVNTVGLPMATLLSMALGITGVEETLKNAK